MKKSTLFTLVKNVENVKPPLRIARSPVPSLIWPNMYEYE